MKAVSHALVPLKRLDAAKSRLAELFTPEERAALMRAMLADVVGALRAARAVVAITIVSAEPEAALLARTHGVSTWDDRGQPWNEALLAAMRDVVREPCATIVSADLPLLRAVEVEALVAATPARGIAVGRALDGGTNAVSMRPPALFPTLFGEPASAGLHLARAAGEGADAVVLDEPGLALDLDAPVDAERVLAVDRSCETARLLSRILAGRVA